MILIKPLRWCPAGTATLVARPAGGSALGSGAAQEALHHQPAAQHGGCCKREPLRWKAACWLCPTLARTLVLALPQGNVPACGTPGASAALAEPAMSTLLVSSLGAAGKRGGSALQSWVPKGRRHALAVRWPAEAFWCSSHNAPGRSDEHAPPVPALARQWPGPTEVASSKQCLGHLLCPEQGSTWQQGAKCRSCSSLQQLATGAATSAWCAPAAGSAGQQRAQWLGAALLLGHT